MKRTTKGKLRALRAAVYATRMVPRALQVKPGTILLGLDGFNHVVERVALIPGPDGTPVGAHFFFVDGVFGGGCWSAVEHLLDCGAVDHDTINHAWASAPDDLTQWSALWAKYRELAQQDKLVDACGLRTDEALRAEAEERAEAE